MRVFNSLQSAALLAAGPSIIGWLFTEPFIYSNIIKWLAIVVYLILTWLVTACIYFGSKEMDVL